MKHSDIIPQKKSTTIAAISLAVWTLVVLIIPNIELSYTEDMSLWARLANVAVPLGVYMVLMGISRKVGRSAVLMFPFMFFAAFQMVLIYLYGRSVIAVDMFLNVVTTNPGEVGELLGNLTPIMIIVFVLFLPPLIVGVIAWVRYWMISHDTLHILRKGGLAILAVGILLGVVARFAGGNYAVHKHLFPVNAIYNMCTAVNRTMLTSDYENSSREFSYHAISERSDSVPQTYVLVVGETSRAINWQLLGGDAPTNPSLVGREGLVTFDRVLSQSNTTHKSVPMLMSYLDASNFGDSIYSAKGIITAFKEAGFQTWFLSNQLRNRSFIDFFGMEADTCLFIRDYERGESLHSDFSLLPYFRRALRASAPRKLIVLHTYGSHFNYADRYPENMRVFTPDYPTEAKREYRKSLINAYDNSVLATSALLDSVITALDAAQGVSAMLYTSDHGEDIFDDDRGLFLHASPCPSYYQIHVPMLLWVSPAFDAAYPRLKRNALGNSHRYVASSGSYFHTAMQLAGLKSPYMSERSSVASETYAEPDPIYLNDHNEAVPLEDCGLMEHDFIKLDSLGVKLKRQ